MQVHRFSEASLKEWKVEQLRTGKGYTLSDAEANTVAELSFPSVINIRGQTLHFGGQGGQAPGAAGGGGAAIGYGAVGGPGGTVGAPSRFFLHGSNATINVVVDEPVQVDRSLSTEVASASGVPGSVAPDRRVNRHLGEIRGGRAGRPDRATSVDDVDGGDERARHEERRARGGPPLEERARERSGDDEERHDEERGVPTLRGVDAAIGERQQRDDVPPAAAAKRSAARRPLGKRRAATR